MFQDDREPPALRLLHLVSKICWEEAMRAERANPIIEVDGGIPPRTPLTFSAARAPARCWQCRLWQENRAEAIRKINIFTARPVSTREREKRGTARTTVYLIMSAGVPAAERAMSRP